MFHEEDREMDMQLHSHCVIMNDIQCPDSKWRSLWHYLIVDALVAGEVLPSTIGAKSSRARVRMLNIPYYLVWDIHIGGEATSHDLTQPNKE